MELHLDSGEVYHVHSIFLRQNSDVFDEALDLAAPMQHGSAAASLQLPGISSQQLLLCLGMLYTRSVTAAWLDGLPFEELRQLATVLQALSCKRLLPAVDSSIVKQAGTSVDASNVKEVYIHAAQCGLHGLQQACLELLLQTQHQPEDAAARSECVAEDLLMPVLREAHHQKELLLAEARQQKQQLLDEVVLTNKQLLELQAAVSSSKGHAGRARYDIAVAISQLAPFQDSDSKRHYDQWSWEHQQMLDRAQTRLRSAEISINACL